MTPGIAFAAFVTLAAAGAEPTPLSSRITAVTVYSDRAQVTRTAAVEFPVESGRVAIARLPGWIDAESVRVALDPPGAGLVLDKSRAGLGSVLGASFSRAVYEQIDALEKAF